MTNQNHVFKKFVTGVYSFVNAFIPEVESKGKGIYHYGTDNRLPNNLLAWVNDSGIARRCVSKVSAYITANGFVDAGAGNTIVSNHETANHLLSLISASLAYFSGFALHIKRDGSGKVVSANYVPFQCIRKRLDGGFEVNLTYGQPRFDQRKTVVYAPYKGPLTEEEFIQGYAQISKGELLYAFIPSPDNAHYPNPEYYAQIEDIRTSAELARFDYETVTNGFITSAILSYVGELDDKQRDESGKTEVDYFKQSLKEFTGQVKNNEGVSGRNKLLVLNSRTAEQQPTLTSFDSKAIFDASNAKREIIDRAVCRLFGVHPVLVGFSDASVLGNTQSIANASLELNKNVQPYQNLITQTFKRIWPDRNWELSEYTPVNYVDPALYQYMTADEIRAKLLHLPPLTNPINVTTNEP